MIIVPGISIDLGGAKTTIHQLLVVVKPVDDAAKRLAHDTDLNGNFRSDHFTLNKFHLNH